MLDEEAEALKGRLKTLQLEHRHLDDAVVRLAANPRADQLQLRRLKKRKLLLKDLIARLKSQLIPDLNA